MPGSYCLQFRATHGLHKDFSHQSSGCFILYAALFCDVGSERSSIFLLTEDIVVAYEEIHWMQTSNTFTVLDLICLKAEHKPIPYTGRVSKIFKSKQNPRMKMLQQKSSYFLIISAVYIHHRYWTHCANNWTLNVMWYTKEILPCI